METEAALAVRIILAIGLGWLLTFTFGRRLLRLDLRGAGVVGGVCAGIALGPMVLGKLAPDFYENVFIGGVEMRQSLESLRAASAENIRALRESGVTDVAVQEVEAAQQHSLAHREQQLESLLAWHRDVPLAVASAIGLVALMLGSMRVRGASLDGIRIGAVTALIAGLAWAVLARKVIGADLRTSAALGGVLAAGTVWSRGKWRTGFGLTGVIIAIVLLCVGDALGAAWRALSAIGLGVLLGRIVAFGPKGQRRAAWIAHGLIVPAVAALMVSSCDLSHAPTDGLLFVMVAGVLGADAHFIAAYLALGWLGRGWRHSRPMTAWHGAYAQGWGGTQIILANLVLAFGLLESQPEIAGVIGLAAAAMAMTGEITRPATHKSLILMRRQGATSHL